MTSMNFKITIDDVYNDFYDRPPVVETFEMAMKDVPDSGYQSPYMLMDFIFRVIRGRNPELENAEILEVIEDWVRLQKEGE